MKGSIFQLLVFLILFIFLSLGIAALLYFYWADAGFFSDSGNSAGFFSILPSFLFRVFPLSLLGSIIFSLFSTLRLKVNRVVSILLIFISGSGIYFFGFPLLSHFNAGTLSSREGGSRPPIRMGKFNPFPGGLLYVEKSDPLSFHNVIIENDSKKGPSFYFEKEMDRDAVYQLFSSGGNKISLSSLSLLFRPPSYFKGFFDGMGKFIAKMEALRRQSCYFFLFAVFSQIFFTIACWSLLRISRWPLVNVFLACGLITGLFRGYFFWDSPAIQSKLTFISNSVIRDNSFSGILLFCAFLIVFLDSLIILSQKSSKGTSNE